MTHTRRIATRILALSALTLAGHAGTGPALPDAATRQRLRAAEVPGLETLRAGAPAPRRGPDEALRASLRRAERASEGLDELRAGATNNELLTVIAVAAVIVALVVLL